MCSATFQGDSEFSKHVVECAMKDHSCEFCTFTSQKASNVKRHMKRAHKGMIETPLPLRGQSTPKKKEVVQGNKTDEQRDCVPLSCEQDLQVSSSESEEDDWLCQDPGELLLEEQGNAQVQGDELLAGRLFRKKTQPSLPGKRSSIQEATVPLPEAESTSSQMSTATTQTDDVPVKKLKCDAFTQTEFATEVSKKRIRKFRDGDIDIEEITTEKFILC